MSETEVQENNKLEETILKKSNPAISQERITPIEIKEESQDPQIIEQNQNKKKKKFPSLIGLETTKKIFNKGRKILVRKKKYSIRSIQ